MTKFLALACFLVACTSGAESTGIEPMSCDPASTLTYANFGAAFIRDNCLSCHDSKESPRLITQAAVQANASDILQEAVYTKAMPEDADISLAEREMLGNWLACGAP
jgi:uncharacterized membrane protein